MKGKKYLCLAIVSLVLSGILCFNIPNISAYRSYIPREIQIQGVMLLSGFTILFICSMLLFYSVYQQNKLSRDIAKN